VDVQETDKEVRIDVGIPGVRADEVEITVENGVLTIRGDKQTLRKEGDKVEKKLKDKAEDALKDLLGQ
jgi:HSP20 family protein